MLREAAHEPLSGFLEIDNCRVLVRTHCPSVGFSTMVPSRPSDRTAAGKPLDPPEVLWPVQEGADTPNLRTLNVGQYPGNFRDRAYRPLA